MDKFYPYFILRRQLNTKDKPSNFLHDPETDQQDRYDAITKVNMFIKTWEVDRGPQIPGGNYDISKILELIETQFHMVFSNKTINLKINPYQYRVEIKRM